MIYDTINLTKDKLNSIDLLERTLLETCQILKIPMFCSVVTENDSEHTEYMNIVYGCQSHVINLKKDNIRNHILIANQFEISPAKEGWSLKFESRRKTIIRLSQDEEKLLNSSMNNIKQFCNRNNLPYFLTAVVSNTDDETKYLSYSGRGERVTLSPDGKQKIAPFTLKNDQIEKHLKITEGFHAVPARNITTFDIGGILT